MLHTCDVFLLLGFDKSLREAMQLVLREQTRDQSLVIQFIWLCWRLGVEVYKLNIVLSALQLMKEFCHVRVTNLPVCPELTRITVPLTADVSRMVSFRGIHSSS